MPKHKTFDSDSENEDFDLGKHTASTKLDNTRPTVDLDDSDSDAAPDDIAFEDSRVTALQKVKAALDQIDSEKFKKREKRKAVQQKHAEEKRQKLASLEKKKLPSDILNDLEDEPIKAKKAQRKQVEDEEDKLEEHLIPDEGFEEDDDKAPEIENTDTGILAVYTKDELRKPKSSAQNAAEFLKNRLYGKKGQREKSTAYIGKLKKKKAMFS